MKLFFEALEDLLNTYERACSMYLDGKVDCERFKKDYHVKIRKLVEEGNYRDKYFPPHTSKFKDILEVYNQWQGKSN